jgi:hypothetical protein
VPIDTDELVQALLDRIAAELGLGGRGRAGERETAHRDHRRRHGDHTAIPR